MRGRLPGPIARRLVHPDRPVMIEGMVMFAETHDRRANVAVHAFGVPLLYLAGTVLLGLPHVRLGITITAADLVWIALAVFWIRLDARLGLATSALALPVLWFGNHLAAQGWADAVLASVAFAIVGVACELGGHALEGSRPLVLTESGAPLIAPFFLVATAGFAWSLREGLAEEVDRRVRHALDQPASYEPLADL